MKPAKFDYVDPKGVEEVLDVLAEYGEDARILAGGLSFTAMMNFRLVQPKVVIDISRLSELSYIRVDDTWLVVGAATTQADLLAWTDLEVKQPLLKKAMPHIGHFQTRSRGTVCGSICHGEPSSELPLCLATLEGEVLLQSKRSKRTLKASEFQLGLLSNARRPDELVHAVRFPIGTPREGYAFKEVAIRRGDFAIVALAAIATQQGVRLGVGGLADRPVVRDLGNLSSEALDEALNAFAWELQGGSDIHATAKYRRHLIRKLGPEVIEEARSCPN